MALSGGEQTLHALAGELIRDGVLPCEVERALWAGSGDGSDCALCKAAVLPQQIEYEVEDRSGRTYRFHVRCHALWLLALTDR